MQNRAIEIQFPLYGARRSPKEKGDSGAPQSRLGCVPRVAQVLALAIYFQDAIERGEARDYADLARLGCLTRERMSQIMELVWLAPDIQQEVLEFPPRGVTRFPISEVALRRVASFMLWDHQRAAWAALKEESL